MSKVYLNRAGNLSLCTQAIENTGTFSANCNRKKTKTAKDYSQLFHKEVCSYFLGHRSIKQTAAEFGISNVTVNEILHLANLTGSMPVNSARPFLTRAA